MKHVDIAITTKPDAIMADVCYDGEGYPCQMEWGVYGADVRVEQRTVYEGRRHMVLALLAQGAVVVRWFDLVGAKTFIFTIRDIDELLLSG